MEHDKFVDRCWCGAALGRTKQRQSAEEEVPFPVSDVPFSDDGREALTLGSAASTSKASKNGTGSGVAQHEISD